MYRIAIYKSTIYIDGQKILANHFLDFIYRLAKLIGKMSEIQTHNYRQL